MCDEVPNVTKKTPPKLVANCEVIVVENGRVQPKSFDSCEIQ
jgi:hypothetical protein